MAPISAAASGSILAFLLLPALMFGHAAARDLPAPAYTYTGQTLGTVKVSPPDSSPAPAYSYTVQTGMEYAGNDIAVGTGTPSLACGDGLVPGYNEAATACEARCDAAFTCAGFVHTADSNCCYIKSAMVNQNNYTVCTSYLKRGYGDAYQGYTVEYGQDYPSNDIPPIEGDPTNPGVCYPTGLALSAPECIARCDNLGPGCVGIAQYTDRNCCYLKTALTGKKGSATVVTYIKGEFLENLVSGSEEVTLYKP